MQKIDVEYLYKRFNGYVGGNYVIQSANSLIKAFLEDVKNPKALDDRIIDLEAKSRLNNPEKLGLRLDKDFVQPKSIFLRLIYLDLVSKSLPESFFSELNITPLSILQITTSILLYYTELDVKTVIGKPMTSSQNKYLLRREDYCFGLEELKVVCWEIDQKSFDRYVNLFVCDVSNITEDSKEAFYRYKGNLFILAREEFVDYILIQIEKLFFKVNDEQAISKYMNNKGFGFEDIVYHILKSLNVDSLHGLYYYPSKDKNSELDIVIKGKDCLAIVECKSGTINLSDSSSDDEVKNRIKTKTKKAHQTLYAAAKYFANSDHYELKNKDKRIVMEGECRSPVLLNVSMYPLDFISSNLHTIIPEYIEGTKNPVITISFEHLFAIILESYRNDRDYLEYFKRRKEYISKYPEMRFENNELDLYYELAGGGKDTMLAELERQGLLDQILPSAKLIGSYHDEFGNENRPARRMTDELDKYLLGFLIAIGKKAFGLNKRYLRFFEEYITETRA